MKLLDCTLRDGGYYTDWDFDRELVDTYIRSFNHLPVDYLEIGYRSNPQPEYLGEYFYCPVYVMERIRAESNKKLAIILNEKDVREEDVKTLISPCSSLIDLIRIAVNPANFDRALSLGKAIKKMGFEVSFNMMYMSDWETYPGLFELMKDTEGVVDYLYLVDSFGGVYPHEVRQTIQRVRDKTDTKLGFHGHNNLEMALANTLTAIEEGVDIVDSTVTGMGRGAGNLKTELLLTVLNSKGFVDFDYNWLSKVTDSFQQLQRNYDWGTNLPYMVSGANSIPQKKVMGWVTKRFYSFNSIIRALSNQSQGRKDNVELPVFTPTSIYDKTIIVGGGPSVKNHKEAIHNVINKGKDNVCLIFASSKNSPHFKSKDYHQIHALSGNEGYRLENTFSNLNTENRVAVFPPFPREMGTYIPKILEKESYQLDAFREITINNESVTALCIEIALLLNPKEIQFIGYDGYDGNVSEYEVELFNENNDIFERLGELNINFYSITPTKYEQLPVKSVYSELT
jgi:4-hydroxy 2-oxovalerate aldolase